MENLEAEAVMMENVYQILKGLQNLVKVYGWRFLVYIYSQKIATQVVVNRLEDVDLTLLVRIFLLIRNWRGNLP